MNFIHRLARLKSVISKYGISKAIPSVIFHLFTQYLLYRRSKPEKVFSRYGLEKVVVSLLTGQEFLINTHDQGLSTSILFFKKREVYPSDYLLDYFGTNKLDLFIDVGANLGYYSVLLADLADNIIAVEPVLQNFRTLIQNLEINHLTEKSVCEFMGLGRVSEEKTIVIPRHLNLAQIADNIDIQNSKAITQMVRIDTLDNLTQKNSRCSHLVKAARSILIKMDVEGYESEILKGGSRFLESKKPMIFLEFHLRLLGLEKSRDLIGFLQDKGYVIKKCFVEPPSVWYSARPWERKIFERLFVWLRGHRFGEISLTFEQLLANPDMLSGNFHSALELILENKK